MRHAFTMVELIFVIVIIGILSSMAVPKFTGVRDQANRATELATASAISAAIEAIHGTWSISDNRFDINNDGVIDDDDNLSDSGYPISLSRNDDDLGALIKGASKTGFVDMAGVINKNGTTYRLYTGKASNPVSGVKFSSKASKDVEGKPDKNDIWIYMIDTNNTTQKCYVEVSGASKKRQIVSGDFMLIDVNNTSNTSVSDVEVSCS